MTDEPTPARRRYVKPTIERVDMIEDEVALASCKANFNTTHSTPNAGLNKCKTTCKTVTST
jgi:hypothetical protein